MSNRSISKESKEEALKIARVTQKPGQTKQQTKLIVQGIEKGIAEYKKQQKIKARERNKRRIKPKPPVERERDEIHLSNLETRVMPKNAARSLVPWGLLLASWVGFLVYLLKFS